MRESRIDSLVIYCAMAGSLFLAISGLIAYIPGFEMLGRVRADYIPMAPTTSSSFILLSIILLLGRSEDNPPIISVVIYSTISAVGIFGLLELAGFLIGMDLNFEEILVPKLGELNGIPVGRMSPSTGVLFFFSSVSLFGLFLSKRTSREHVQRIRHFSGWISCLTALSATTILLGYLYGTPFFYGQQTIPMALTTALGFMALSVGIITANGRDFYPLKSFVGRSTAVRLKRIFLPLIVIFILIQSSVNIVLEPLISGLNDAFVTAIIVTLYVFGFGFVINKVSKLIGRQIDETEKALRESERQLAMAHRLEAMGQLAAGIAHEINTPLQYIGGNLQFMKQSLPEVEAALKAHASNNEPQSPPDILKDNEVFELIHEQESAVADSLKGVNHITTIVKAMKKSSHPSADSIQLVDIKALIESAVLISRNEWKYVAEIDLNLDDEAKYISCSPAGMTQVILNLLLNAAQAIDTKSAPESPKGKITITTFQEDGMLAFSVQDNGCGIPKDNIDRVYDPFFTTKKIGKGTGQGLSIVYSILETHKGSIELESQVGAGTTFTVKLPM